MEDIALKIEKELLGNYQKYYRLVFSYTRNEQDALDAVQEGAYKAIKNSYLLKEEEYISTWICRIMINEALQLIRKRPAAEPEESIEELYSVDNYENIDMWRALAKLDTTDQTIIKLKYFEELQLKEIAQILEMNESTVKSRLYRSLDKLKALLED